MQKNENHRIPYENNENHGNPKIQFETNEHHENHVIPL